ncbi:TetR/AcrR family transcriptional regulator [Actinomadura rugatobispora]|uniref:TetR/AcrR family transcriptional regulator n=1 Tax=Actinomadura rugatobispora TaxID=1994 RepID=A0ABW1AGK8_9ACTN|nr:TetR/AcrR family transcriptional regulator [Actinomadura rugatobispora]
MPEDPLDHLDTATARPGGRTARVRQAVFDATVAELSEVGYAALRVEAVAERAGVNKSTVYRRWRNKATLVSAAIVERRGELVPPPDTGTLRGDLIALLQEIRLGLKAPWVTALLREAAPRSAKSAELYELLDRFWPERFQVAGAIFERAVERGELPAGTDPDFLLQMISGPLYFRLLMLGRPLDDAFLERTADLVLDGARGGDGGGGAGA